AGVTQDRAQHPPDVEAAQRARRHRPPGAAVVGEGEEQHDVDREQAERTRQRDATQADQFGPHAGVRAEPPPVEEHGEVDRMAEPVVHEVAGVFEMRLQRHGEQHQRQRGQDQQRLAAQVGDGVRQATQQRQQRGEHQRVRPQVRQVPQVVPGEAVFPAVERPRRPRRAGVVAREEGPEPRRDQPVRHALGVRLDRHDHQHPEHQRQQQAPGAQADEAADRGVAHQEMHRQPGDQEDQVHAPAVDQQHRQLDRFGGVEALEVPAPVFAADVEHGPVVEDEQGEGEGAQGVDVVAAGRQQGVGHGGGPLEGARTLARRRGAEQREGTELRGRGTNRGGEGRADSVPSPRSATMRGMSTVAAAPSSPPSAWERFRPWKRTFEVGFWVVTYLINAIANSAVTWLDIQRAHLGFKAWEPAVWEWTSAVVCLALVPAVAWYTNRVPVRFDTWKRALPLHLLGSVAWSITHVAGMVALRKAAYAMQGTDYDFGNWLHEWGYEYLKDIRSYFGLVA